MTAVIQSLTMFDPGVILAAGVVVFAVVVVFAAIRGIGSIAAERAAIKVETRALVDGGRMPAERKERAAGTRKRGLGLRFKIASFTIALVMLVVFMVSAPLYYIMTQSRWEVLLRGLWDRSTVLLDGLSASVTAYLPAGNVLELGLLPAQITAIPEARSVTITDADDRVWATNDPDILRKLDTVELRPGVSRLSDALSPRLAEIGRRMNYLARERAGDLPRNIAALTREAEILAPRPDYRSRTRLNNTRVTINELEARLAQILAEIAAQIGSEPAFAADYTARRGPRRFMLFKPVMYDQGDGDFFRGLIRLEVSTDLIIAQITDGEILLLRAILVVALAAIALGIIGALALSTLIIRPVRTLARHVEIIRDTEDKADLAGLDIHLTTHDEIAVLGETINDMTHGLVSAAAAASDLSIGREIQKKFLPLETDRKGNKLTSGYQETRRARFFGYYEGARGVSGDYFDYYDLNGRFYAIIKCDVAGKGVPAALIMVQVATMFRNYCKQWKPTARGMHIEELVYQINDFIETLGFQGRFAAFTLCLFDSQTGALRFCNAGDNIVHLFDAGAGRLKAVTLPETPAAGALSNRQVQEKGGYRIQDLTLDHGDMLLLYTDGIEEAKRQFRDSDFNEIRCAEGRGGAVHGNHMAGQNGEELGADRVRDIINAVMNRQPYILRKWHNPESGDPQFDFSACAGRIEDVIMALVSVEKIFRCYRDPRAGDDSRVLVDKKVDAFLRAHFLQYRRYGSCTRESPGNDAYMYYTHVREDEQYDDLTILGIQRK